MICINRSRSADFEPGSVCACLPAILDKALFQEAIHERNRKPAESIEAKPWLDRLDNQETRQLALQRHSRSFLTATASACPLNSYLKAELVLNLC